MINTCESLFEKLMRDEGYHYTYFEHNPKSTFTAKRLNELRISKKECRPYSSDNPFAELNDFEDALAYLILKDRISVKDARKMGFHIIYLIKLLKRYSLMLNKKGELKKQEVPEETYSPAYPKKIHSPNLSAEQKKKAKEIYHTFRV